MLAANSVAKAEAEAEIEAEAAAEATAAAVEEIERMKHALDAAAVETMALRDALEEVLHEHAVWCEVCMQYGVKYVCSMV